MADNKPITESEIQSKQKDSLGTDLYGGINGLYYYYLEESLFKAGGSNNTSVLGTTEAIANVCLVPFLNIDKSNLYKVPYDTTRYGTINGQSDKPYVYRLWQGRPTEMELDEIDLYPADSVLPSKGTNRHYKYESRLLDYPYRTIAFQSNAFDQYEVIPHLMEPMKPAKTKTRKVKLRASSGINPGGNFFVYVHQYKNDFMGKTERYYSNTSMDIPNSSSAYSNYMSTQKARTATGVQNTMLSAVGNIAGAAALGAAGGSIVPGAGTAAGLMFGAAAGGIISVTNSIKNVLATEKDLISTPNSLKSMGGDVISRFGIANGIYVAAVEYMITNEYKRVLGDYFAMYGYKQNKVMNLGDHLRSRHYYNYVKTIGANIKGVGVPKKYLSQIKAIYDKGITLWHVDRNGGKICDYTLDNTEEHAAK